MKPIFVKIDSFFDTVQSIYRIEIFTDKFYHIYIKPKIKITTLLEKSFNIKKEEIEKKKSFETIWQAFKKKYPPTRFKYITYRFKESKMLKIDEFAILAKTFNPNHSSPKNIEELVKLYEETINYYENWKKENKPYDKKLFLNLILINKNNFFKENPLNFSVKTFFGTNGFLAKNKNFSYRKEQEELALTIKEGMENNLHLFLNAPTGIGKTMAYLINIAEQIKKYPKKRFIISTFTKKLQNQLKEKDIPMIEKLICKNLNTLFLKGRDNYICLEHLTTLLSSPNIEEEIKDYLYEKIVNQNIYEYNEYELPDEIKNELKINFCPQKLCKFYKNCIYYRIKEELKNANIIVLNHSLFIKLLRASALNNFTNLIIDEAHHLEEVIAEELGGSLDQYYFDFLEKEDKKIPLIWRELFNRFEILTSEEIFSFLHRLNNIKLEDNEETFALIEKISLLKHFFANPNNYFLEKEEKDEELYYHIHIKNIGSWTDTMIWKNFDSVALLSGTLFQETLLPLTQKLYNAFGERFIFKRFDSPFEYEKKVRFFVPIDFPKYNYREKEKYIEATIEFLKEYTIRTETKTMVLFTSYEDMEFIAEELTDFLNENGIKLFINNIDEEKLREENFYIIFGTYSLWEGVDIDNNLINSLIMIKTPFSSPNEGRILAKKEFLDDKTFFLYYLNEAITKFRQGFGRLIRKNSDKGIFILLDNRITEKSYKSLFLKSISSNFRFDFKATRDIFNEAEYFLFDEEKVFLPGSKVYSTYKFLDYNQVYLARDGAPGIKIIRGSAGTGKTVVLLQRIKFLLMKFPHIKRILFITFNASMATYIKNILYIEEMETKNKTIDINYFFQFCSKIKKKTDESFSSYYQDVYRHIKEKGTPLEKYDAIFVDEGQDFSELQFKIIFSHLKKKQYDIMIAIDPIQNIYNIDFANFFKTKKVTYYSLDKPYRNSAEIMLFANKIINNLFISKSDIIFNKGEKPLIYQEKSLEKIFETIYSIIYEKKISIKETIVIYTAKKLYEKDIVTELTHFFKKKQIKITDISDFKHKKRFLLLQNELKISKIHSVKGLEFKNVIIIGADNLKISEQNKKLLYVAITRAKEKLIIPYLEAKGFIDLFITK